MSDHPEFPQVSPAIKYIIEQVAKIEDAQACGVGYYKSLGKVLARLDKTDEILTQLKQTTTDLKRVTDSDVIAATIGKKSDDINNTITSGLVLISNSNSKVISDRLIEMQANSKTSLATINGTNELAKRTQEYISEQMGVTIARLDNHIKSINDRVVPPWWKLWAYMILTLIVGILIGRGI